jgi:Rieske Fe-S protein
VSDERRGGDRGGTGAPLGQEKWRQDFPYTAAGEEEVTRREFVRYLTVGSVGAALGSVFLAGMTQVRRPPDVGEVAVVALEDIPVPGTYLFHYPTEQDPAILVRSTEDDLRGFSQRCTHLACVVYYEHDERELICPCHGGHFDASDGRNLAGPPQRPLNRIELEVRDGVVWALGGGGH